MKKKQINNRLAHDIYMRSAECIFYSELKQFSCHMINDVSKYIDNDINPDSYHEQNKYVKYYSKIFECEIYTFFSKHKFDFGYFPDDDEVKDIQIIALLLAAQMVLDEPIKI